MQTNAINEARRQAEICNSCRYCEGYCSVFPALHRERIFADGDITQLANLCHNCRGCYYACQYTEPHEFAINLPKALAEVRQESWEDFAFPRALGSAFHKSGFLISIITILGIAILLWCAKSLAASSGGEGFYAVLSHKAMLAIFMPAFLFPLLALAISLRRYWVHVGGGRLGVSDITLAFGSAARMKNLSGGHGDGCNFEDEDRFTHSRRYLHQMVMYGFLLCFASTSSATIMHYGFDLHAPYSAFSLPKLLGVSGGVILSLGTLGMMRLKMSGDKNLSDARVWGGEFGFIFLLFFVSTTGLALYWLGETPALDILLSIHLGAVLAFFLLTPYSKMAHGFYRLAALIYEEKNKRILALTAKT
jgi:citrate/tricarballylate utilization protein